MNRNYKVIWNRSLGCFTAVAEYAKSRGKSSNSVVTSGVSSSTAIATTNTRLLRLSAICLGLAASGISVQSIAAVSYQGDIGNNVIALGSLDVQGGVSNATALTDDNIGVISSSPNHNPFSTKTLSIKLAKNINLSADGSVKTGSTVMDDEGVTIAGGAKFTKSGIDAGTQQIKGVLDGDVNGSSTDAVNGRQLHATNQALAAQKIKYFSVKSTGGGNENNDGATGADAIAIGKDTTSSGVAAIGLGLNAEASGSKSLAFGQNAIASGGQSIAIGGVQDNAATPSTTASGQQSIAIGANVVSSGASSIAMGGDDLDAASQANVDGSTPSSTLNGGTVNSVFRSYAKHDLLDTSNRYEGYTQAEGAASIAIGTKSRSTGALSTAVGVHASTTGVAASAFGVAASASKDGSVALGAGSLTENDATSEKSVMINGKNYNFAGNVLDDNENIKTGAQVSVGSVGAERQIKNVAGGAINDSSTDGVNGSQLFATNASIEDLSDTVAGQKIKYFSVKSTGGGNENNDGATAADAIAIGKDASATGLRAVSLGIGATVTGEDATAIGPQAQALSDRSIALGNLSGAQSSAPNNKSNIAIGGSGDGSVNGFGAGSQVVGRDNIALGTESASIVRGRSNIGIGSETGNNLDGSFNSALGFKAGSRVDGDQNVALGFEAGQKVTANRSTSIGARSKASADDAIAIGTNAKASGSSSISIGKGNTVSGDNSGAIGDPSTITGTGSYSLGNNNSIDADNAFAIGNNVTIANGLNGAVGIGNNSTVSASTVASFVPTGATTVVGTSTGSNVISVGSNGNERRLTNVAAGGADTDAVNVSQLRAVDDQVSTNTGDIAQGIKFNVNNTLNKTFALGEEIKFITDANLTTTALGSNDGITLGLADTISIGSSPTAVTIDGTAGTVSNLSNTTFDPNNFISGQAATEDQLKSVSNVANAGWDITVGQNGGTTTNGGTANIGPGDRVAIDSGKNIDFLVDGTEGVPTLTVSTKDEVEFTQVTIGDTSGDNTVLTSGAGGLDVGGDKLTNVGIGAIGAGSTDAINGSQLFDTNQNVAGNTTALGGSYDPNTDMYIPPSYVLDDGTNSGTTASPYNDVGSALGNLDSRTISNTANIAQGIKFNVNNTLNKTFALGEEIKFNTDSNLTTIALGSNDGITLGLADTISIGSSPTVVTIDGTVGTVSNLSNTTFDAGATYTGGVAATQEQLSELSSSVTTLGFGIKAADGNTVQKNLGEAVDIVGSDSNITTRKKDGKIEVVLNETLDLGNNGSVTTGITTLDDDGVRIIGTNNDVVLTRTGLFNGGNKIRGVTDGEVSISSRDAINGSQLYRTAVSTANNFGGGSSFDSATGTVTPPSYVLDDGTNSGTNASPYNDVGSALGNLDGRTINNTANIAQGIKFNVNNTLNKTFALGEEIKFNTDANLTTIALGSNDGITLGLADTISIGSSPTAVTIDGTAGTVSNLSNTTFDANTTYTGGVAATQEQLSALNGSVTTLGFGIKAADGNTVQKNLGEAVEIIGADDNIDTQVDNGKVEVKLSNTLDLSNIGSVTTGNTLLNDSGVTLNGGSNQVVSLTNNGLDNGNNTITNVAAGSIAASSTEAVNGGQLHNAADALTTVMGGNAVNNGGIISSSNIGDTGKDNIHDAIKSVNTAAVQAKTTVEQGKNIIVTPSTNLDGSTTYTVATDNNLDVTSVTAGDTLLNTSGVSIDDGNGNSAALSAAGSTVTNAAGSSSYGAGGLTASDNDGNSTVVNQDGLSFTDSDGTTGPSVTASGIDAGSTQITDLASGGEVGTNAANINDVRAAIASSKPVMLNGTNVGPIAQTFSADGRDTYIINADGTTASAGSAAMTVTAGLKDENNLTDYAVDLSDITKVSLVRADTAMQSVVTQIDGNDVKTVDQTRNTANFVTGDNIVLSDDNGSIRVATSDNLDVTSVTASTITTGNTTVNSNGLSITDGPSMTADQGINAGGQTVTGVADGIELTDAVNVNQLRAVESNFGSAFNELGYRIDDVEKESRAGIAATLALESAPYVPGKFTYAVLRYVIPRLVVDGA